MSVVQLGLLCYGMYYVEKCPLHAQNKYMMAIHCITVGRGAQGSAESEAAANYFNGHVEKVKWITF